MAANSRLADVLDTNPLRAVRRRQVRRTRLRRVLIAVAAVVVTALLVWLVWFSPVLVARSVVVAGNSQASTADVVEAAGIRLGTPLIRLDVADARTRVLDGVPAVADVRITRGLTGTVKIVVTERVPAYTIPTGGAFLLVDSTGTGYLTQAEPPAGLLVVTVPADDSETSRRLMADAAVIAGALPDAVTTQMATLAATTPDTFTISLVSGAQILWGSAEESALKAQVIVGLLNVPASFYDVSSPTHPATR